MAQSTHSTRLLDRGLAVLTVIGEAEGSATFAGILQATALPKATLSRILTSLRKQRFVTRDETGGYYVLGPGYTDLLSVSKIDHAGLTAQKAELQRLSDELELPVIYWRVERDDIAPTHQFLPFHTKPHSVERPPSRLDHVAPGVAVLSAMDGTQLSKVLRRFERNGPQPTDNVAQLLGFSAATGFAVREAEDPDGQVEVAAAITNGKSVPVAAMSILCDGDRSSETERHQIGRRVAFVARTLSENIDRAPRRRDVNLRGPAKRRIASEGRPIMCVDDRHFDQVGSAPFWDGRAKRLVWIDSLGGAVNWTKPVPGEARSLVERLPVTDLPGAAAPYVGGRLLLASRDGVSIMKLPGGARTPINHPEPNDALRRFSTAAPDTAGQVWLGTLSPVPAAGAGQGRLYHLGFDGKIRHMLDLDRGIKGLCQSPDGQFLFLSEAGSKAILRFELDEKSNRPVRPRRFAVHREEGTPNGLTMDRDGCLWTTIYGGWCIKRFDPSGREMDRVVLPVPLPTALCFGGARRNQIYVTTCRLHVPPEVLIDAPLSGSVLRLDVDAAGIEFPAFGLKMR